MELAQTGAAERTRHVGYYLFDRPLGRPVRRPTGLVYITAIGAVTLFLSVLAALAAGSVSTGFLCFLPFSELVKRLADRRILARTRPRRLPRLALAEGIPPEGRTLCAVFVLLTGRESAKRAVRRLEEFRMASRDCGENLLFALVCDLPESREILSAEDRELLETTARAVEELNERRGGGFFLFCRERRWDADMKRFLPWERKRGATLELCRYLAGEKTRMELRAGELSALRQVRYILSLDSDTRLEPECARELIGTALHPLNRPLTDLKRGIVVRGHGVLQPRLAVGLRAACRTDFTRSFALSGGADPYGASAGEVYMDRYRSGGFSGKGLIHIRAYLDCMGERIPPHWVLSHDALEGAYLRGGLVNDVELTDGFPASPLSWAAREHRWIRGDWQNLPWLFSAGRGLPLIERWRLFDSLRRSLLPPTLLAGLTACLFAPGAWSFTAAAVSAAVLLPFGRQPRRAAWRGAGLRLMLLPFEAWNCLSAVFLALWRMSVSGHALLQWQTAEQSEAAVSGVVRHYRQMWPCAVLGALLLAVTPLIAGAAAGIVWMAAPAVARAAGQIRSAPRPLPQADRDFLLRQAAQMWRYFRDNCRPETHFLPPDNLQDTPPAAAADRVSPTNLGLALLAALCAGKLGLAETHEVLGLCENLLGTAERLEKWHGHLYNWYDTRSLRPLEPAYVSTVDSGNLAGCLIAASAALRELGGDELAARARMLCRAMDLTALYDEERRLFVVGLSPASGVPASGWYDLLESEERLTGYIAVASGQAPRRHWRQLSRARTSFRGRSGMVSWSGTMFEYLMPELFLPLYNNSHLWSSARFAVWVQRRTTAGRDRLWGVSESAFFSLDASNHYRYKAHGVPALALCRGMGRDLVISPYSSYLALAVCPRAAAENLRRMDRPGLSGPYGLWEAVDYTLSRSPEGQAVRCVMAHHLGMSIAAVTNALCAGAVRRWFLSDPAMAAYTGLLQEKIPHGGRVTKLRREKSPRGRSGVPALPTRQGVGIDYVNPQTAALSNGAYHLFADERGVSRSSCGGILPYRPRLYAWEGCHGLELWLRRDGRLISLLPEPGQAAEWTWEFTGARAALAGKRDGADWTVSAGTSASLPGEWRQIVLRRPADPPAEELYLGLEPVLMDSKDYRAHPSFARLGVFTRSENGVLCVRRLPRNGRKELFLALAADREAEFSSDFRQFPGRGGDGVFVPNEGWQSECFAAARVMLPAGETQSRIRFGLCMSGDADSAAAGARALCGEETGGAHAALAAARLGLDGQEATNALCLLPALTSPFVPPEAAALHAGARDALWKLGLSGDRPFIAAECEGEQSVPAALSVLRRCGLLLACGADFDLVFLTGDEGDYHRRCRSAVEEAAGKLDIAREHIFFASLRQDGDALRAAASVWIGRNGAVLPERCADRRYVLPVPDRAPSGQPEGRFDADGSYTFSPGASLPPRCWGLPLYGGELGWFAADAGTGALWYKNARECPLIPWTGDPLSVCGPERLCAEIGGRAVSFFCAPGDRRGSVSFRFGEAVWEKTAGGVTLRLTAFIPPDRSVRVFLLESSARVKVRWCAPLQMAAEPEDAPECYVNYDDGVLRAENPRCAYDGLRLTARCSAPWEETGTNALAFAFSVPYPAPRSGAPALCGSFTLEGKAVLLCGIEDAPELLDLAAAEAAREDARRWWRRRVCRLHAEGAQDVFSGLLNGWSAYAALCCRVLGRSTVYQSGGAIGFRDQLQDYVNLLWADPEACRRHILCCCAHQFTEGDVQHWWHPGNGETDRGVRTRCSDDLLWLPWAVCDYVQTVGDSALLRETSPYITSPALSEGEKSRYELPTLSGETGTVLDHCRRSIMLTLDRGVGAHGLLLTGGGDWNDGFDGMGPGAESVWLTWFASAVCHRFSRLLSSLGEPDADRFAQVSRNLGEAADDAWDTDHYLRGYYGDGTPLGARNARACRVDSVAQSFAAFCPHADPARVDTALDTALQTLFDRDSGRVLLYTPPFAPEDRAPGYVAAYGPGFRENGGQYTHAAVWLARACFRRGRRADGAAILRALAQAAARPEYGAEPFVLAADVYAAPGREGRAGWSWYTGAAGWWYRVAWEDMLGFRMKGGAASFAPVPETAAEGLHLTYTAPDGSILCSGGEK
ncbi:MAG: hypothetical protein IKQ10_08635 [Oscillospiraceae bacterium]|nr:hypothetical protein [Oscillospiraceae bacterium]